MRGSQAVACELGDMHRKMLSPALQDLFASDKGAFLQKVDAKVDSVKRSFADMVDRFEAQLNSKEKVNLDSVRAGVAAVEGKISAANERVRSIERSIAEERSLLRAVSQRYGNASLQDGTDALQAAIRNRSAALAKSYEADAAKREDFGDLLDGFNRVLNERIKDRRKLQNDNEHYLPIYINSCLLICFRTVDSSGALRADLW